MRLQDIANVTDGAENTFQAAWMNDKPAIILNIQRQPGANVFDVVERVKALLKKMEPTLPKGVRVQV